MLEQPLFSNHVTERFSSHVGHNTFKYFLAFGYHQVQHLSQFFMYNLVLWNPKTCILNGVHICFIKIVWKHRLTQTMRITKLFINKKCPVNLKTILNQSTFLFQIKCTLCVLFKYNILRKIKLITLISFRLCKTIKLYILTSFLNFWSLFIIIYSE